MTHEICGCDQSLALQERLEQVQMISTRIDQGVKDLKVLLSQERSESDRLAKVLNTQLSQERELREQAEKALVEMRRERDEMRDAREESMRDRDAARKDCDKMLDRALDAESLLKKWNETANGYREELRSAAEGWKKSLSERDEARRERDEMRKVAGLISRIADCVDCPLEDACEHSGTFPFGEEEYNLCAQALFQWAREKIK